MTRPVAQVVESQWAMLEHTGQKPRSEKDHLIEVQRKHIEQILSTGLKRCERVEVLEISYPELVADPEAGIQAITAFLPGVFPARPSPSGGPFPAFPPNGLISRVSHEPVR